MVPWYDGGDTNVGNLTLVCSYHHHQFARLGWQCMINAADGLPAWIPPRWMDQQQRPILNARIALRSWDPNETGDLELPLIPDPPGRPPPD